MVEVPAAAIRPLQHEGGGEGGLVEVKRVPPAGPEYVDGAVTENRRQDRAEGRESDEADCPGWMSESCLSAPCLGMRVKFLLLCTAHTLEGDEGRRGGGRGPWHTYSL